MFARWRKRRAMAYQRRGYDYAAGELLRTKGDDDVIIYLEDMVTYGFGGIHPFDKGVIQALRDWRELVSRPITFSTKR